MRPHLIAFVFVHCVTSRTRYSVCAVSKVIRNNRAVRHILVKSFMHVTVPLCMMTYSDTLVYSCECLLSFFAGRRGGVFGFTPLSCEPIFLSCVVWCLLTCYMLWRNWCSLYQWNESFIHHTITQWHGTCKWPISRHATVRARPRHGWKLQWPMFSLCFVAISSMDYRHSDGCSPGW
jgi:hypothetical protein